jgi:putative NIF3 family GTP cyclohydrolase 1 type 2
LKLKQIKAFGELNKKPLGVKGTLKPISVLKLKETLELLLKHPVLLSTPNKKANIKSIGIITGGASHYWKDCLKENPPLDAYITGEMAEQDYFEAAEAGIHMFACGHHASETLGVKALLDLISTKFKIEGHFISTDNPA